MQVIALCRFSYPALGGFQVEHETVEERIAYLYAEARLEERFRLFEAIALPCLRAQTDPDFDFILLVGDSLPAAHLDRLQTLVADVPQVRIVAEPPRNMREVCKEILNDARLSPRLPCLQIRYDDDDAIAVDLVEKARAAARDCQPLLRRHKAVTFTWPKGYVAEVGADGLRVAELYRPLNTAGMAMHVAGKSTLTIHNFNHERIPRFMPVVSFADEAMFLRTHNGFNDSRQGKVKPVKLDRITAAQAQLFHDRFAIDVDHVAQVFGR